MNTPDQYVGRTVQVTKSEKTLVIIGKTHVFPHYDLDENDPTILELKANWSNLRILLPSMMATCDHDMTRLNVHITEDETGTFTITSTNWG